MRVTRCTRCMGELKEADRICPHCGYEQDSAAQPVNALKRGTILHGRYLVGNVIGQGGFGITYVGWDLTLEMKVAVKEYFPSGFATRINSFSNRIEWDSVNQNPEERSQGMDRFLKEARRMARLDEVPSIVRVRDAFGENRTAYIVMDFVEGVTLKTYLLSHGALKYEQCTALLSPILDSLAVIHDRGFIHRDISPDNIMLRPDGSARLLDMGAAVDVRANDGHASTAVIKRNFSAPEQYMESEILGSWTDVYAMGATVYYCMTGKVVPEALEREFKKVPLYFDPGLGIPPCVIKTLNDALALRVEDRIQDMRELKRRLTAGGNENAQGKPGPRETAESEFQDIPPTVPFMENGGEIKTLPRPGESKKSKSPAEAGGRRAREQKQAEKGKRRTIRRSRRAILIAITGLAAFMICAALFYKAQSRKYTDAAKQPELSQVCKLLWEQADVFEEQPAELIKGCNAKLAALDYGAVAVDAVFTAMDAAGEKLGYVIVSHSDDGYSGTVKIAIGMEENGNVTGLEFLEINEIPGMGLRATEPEFKDQYTGKNAQSLTVIPYGGSPGEAEINAISGATVTSKAVTNAVNAALYFGHNYIGQPRAAARTTAAQTEAETAEALQYADVELSELVYRNLEDEDGILLEKYTGKEPYIKLPDEIEGKPVVKLGFFLFTGNETLEGVVLPEKIEYLEWSAFDGCTNLKQVGLPENLKAIGDSVFSGCTSLKRIELPEGLRSIGDSAFDGAGLETITIPSSVEYLYLGADIFRIPQVVIAEGNRTFTMSDGMICKNGNELTAVPDSIEGTFVIPPEISIIGDNAFCGTSLTEVEIPGHVRVVGPKAFDRGHKLRKAVMEEGVEALGYKSFANCEALSEIIIPRSVKTIDFKAFMGCDSLKSVTVSKDCQVADDAFEPGVEIKYYD